MVMETGTIKYVLLLLNFVFAILSIILIGFGIYFVSTPSNTEVDHGEKVAGGITIALGVLIIIVSIFGCLAAINESRPKIIIYIVSLAFLIFVQLSMNSMASRGTKDGLSGSIRDGFAELWKHEETEHGALAFYENWLHCCGVNGTADYKEINHDLPRTCCKEYNCDIPGNVYKVGCQEKFEDYLSDKMLMFSIVNWILIILEIPAVILGWMMFSRLRNESRRGNIRWM